MRNFELPVSNIIEVVAARFEDDRIAVTLGDPNQADCPLVYVNRSFEKLTGYFRTEVLGKNCRFLQGPDTDKTPIAALRNAVVEQAITYAVLKNYTKGGDGFNNFLMLCPIGARPDRRLIMGCQYAFKLGTERRRIIEHIERLGFALSAQDGLHKQTYDTLEQAFKSRSEVAFMHLERYGWRGK